MSRAVETFSVDDVQEAFRRCSEANPTVAPAYAMSPDAAMIADVLAHMIYHAEDEVRVGDVPENAAAAISRWSRAA